MPALIAIELMLRDHINSADTTKMNRALKQVLYDFRKFPRTFVVRILKVIAWVVACAFVGSTVVGAAQKSDAIKIGIKISTICRIVASDVDFGTTLAVTGAETATSTVSVWCSTGVPFSLSFAPTGRIPTFNGTLVGQTPGNTTTIPFRLRRTGSSGTGLGHGALSALTFPIAGTLTATPGAMVDTYSRTVTIYLNY